MMGFPVKLEQGEFTFSSLGSKIDDGQRTETKIKASILGFTIARIVVF